MKAAHQAVQSACRGAARLVDLLEPEGSLRGGRLLSAYYKTPFALTVAGHAGEAERVLDYVQSRFLSDDGDLDGAGVEWYDQFRIYPHAWLCCAAMMRGRFDLAQALLKKLIAYHDPRTGGFFATEQGARTGKGPQEIMTTSMAGLACLWAGRIDIALLAADWLEKLFHAQPDLTRGLHQVWNPGHGLVTTYPSSQAVSYLVDARELKQWYFQYGISAALLAAVSAAAGDARWLKLAHQYLMASRHCREDVFTRPQSGKIGWGAAWTYRLSQDPTEREMCRNVIAGLCAIQAPDGSWDPSGAYGAQSGAATDSVIDVTAEFVALQSSMGFVHGI